MEMYRGLREETGMKTYVHGPMDYAKTLKSRFRVGDPHLPELRKSIPVVGRKRKIHICPLVSKQIEYRTNMLGECEMYKEERDVLEEMREIDECDMERFGTLDSSEKTIAILGDRRRNKKGKR